MKRATAERNLKKIIERLHSINGILSTPLHNKDAIKVKRAWLFGSFAKGKDEPNDLDIFVETKSFRRDKSYYIDKSGRLKRKYLPDKWYRRTYGMLRPIQSDETLVKWLRKDIRKVSVHFVGGDPVFDKLDKKTLIYPRCDFEFLLDSKGKPLSKGVSDTE